MSSGSLIVLDEPITNLDAKLREEMAYEIRSLQASTGVTILYITHDQETAMTIADRMVIMDREGLIHQIGSPEEVWTKPEDKYVFEFLGVSNFVPVRLEQGKLTIKDGATFQQVDFKQASGAGGSLDRIDDALLAIRPMDVLMYPKPKPGMLTGRVERVTYLGNQFDYIVSLGDRQLRVQQDSYDAFSKGVPLEGEPCGLDLGNSVFYRSSDARRLELA